MRCLCCGTENNDNANVCATCGRSFANQPPPLTADGGGYNNALRSAPHVKPMYDGHKSASFFLGLISVAFVVFVICLIAMSTKDINELIGLTEAYATERFGVWLALLLAQMWLILTLALSALGLSLGI